MRRTFYDQLVHARQGRIVARHATGHRRSNEWLDRTERLHAAHPAAPHRIRTNEHARRVHGQHRDVRIERAIVCVAGMVAAFETAYEQRGDVERAKIREGVAEYDADRVAVEHMGPVVDELLERMAGRMAA